MSQKDIQPTQIEEKKGGKIGFSPECTPLHRQRAAEFVKTLESGKREKSVDFRSYVIWLYASLHTDSCDVQIEYEFAHVLDATSIQSLKKDNCTEASNL